MRPTCLRPFRETSGRLKGDDIHIVGHSRDRSDRPTVARLQLPLAFSRVAPQEHRPSVREAFKRADEIREDGSVGGAKSPGAFSQVAPEAVADPIPVL
jgi:hypothetical protein